jgi:hypothetical protein
MTLVRLLPHLPACLGVVENVSREWFPMHPIPAVGDALKSIRLFKLHQQLQASPPAWEAAQQALLAVPPQPSFARQNPAFEGVCMGNRKTCTCGAPFFG